MEKIYISVWTEQGYVTIEFANQGDADIAMKFWNSCGVPFNVIEN